MRAIGEEEETRRWWAVTDGMQESLMEGATGSEKGGWWMVSAVSSTYSCKPNNLAFQGLQEVFRMD